MIDQRGDEDFKVAIRLTILKKAKPKHKENEPVEKKTVKL